MSHKSVKFVNVKSAPIREFERGFLSLISRSLCKGVTLMTLLDSAFSVMLKLYHSHSAQKG
jgi:hypothetical protein